MAKHRACHICGHSAREHSVEGCGHRDYVDYDDGHAGGYPHDCRCKCSKNHYGAHG